jgi:hypothetical protein
VIFLDCLSYSYHAHRGKESFETHVWMLKTLLGQLPAQAATPNSRDLRDEFSLYIIAASFPKILVRMKRKVSIDYFCSLQKVTKFPFIQLPSKEPKAGDSMPSKLVNVILELGEVTETKIPHLLHAANLPDLSEIYDESTCLEFHLLLCEIFSKYNTSLEELQRERSKKEESRELSAVLKALNDVMVCGDYLRSMVRSDAVETHLQTIATYLFVDSRKLWTPQVEDDEDFTDFQRLKPYSMRKGKPLLPWESYRDWLMLMVHYFDAADKVVTFVSKLEHPDISIAILTPPHPDKTILPWNKLLKNERYFPPLTGEPTGKDFVDFLTSTSKVDIKKTLMALREGLESIPVTPKDILDGEIDKLAEVVKNCPLDGYEYFEDIHDKILDVKKLDLKFRPAQMEKVVEMLIVLEKRDKFYTALNKKDGLYATGTYHCEVYVASLLALLDTSGGDRKFVETPKMSSIKKLLDRIKASHAFMLRLNLY